MKIFLFLFGCFFCCFAAQANPDISIIGDKVFKKNDCVQPAKDDCSLIATRTTSIIQNLIEAPAETYQTFPEVLEARHRNSELYKIDKNNYIEKLYLTDQYLKVDNQWKKIDQTIIKGKLQPPEIITNLFKIPNAFALVDTTSSIDNRDNYLYKGNPTTNYGTQEWIYIDDWGSGGVSLPDRGVIAFTLPAVPASTTVINSLKLFLFKTTNSPNSGTYYIEAHAITQPAWTETGSSWNNYKTSTAWGTAGGDYSATIIDKILDDTPVDNWDNWVLKGTGSDNPIDPAWGSTINLLLRTDKEDALFHSAMRYASKENSTVAHRPYLEINFTITTSTPSVATSSWLCEYATSAEAMGTRTGILGINQYAQFLGVLIFGAAILICLKWLFLTTLYGIKKIFIPK